MPDERAQAPASPAAGTIVVGRQEAAGAANDIHCAAGPIAGGTPEDARLRRAETFCCFANGRRPTPERLPVGALTNFGHTAGWRWPFRSVSPRPRWQASRRCWPGRAGWCARKCALPNRRRGGIRAALPETAGQEVCQRPFTLRSACPDSARRRGSCSGIRRPSRCGGARQQHRQNGVQDDRRPQQCAG